MYKLFLFTYKTSSLKLYIPHIDGRILDVVNIGIQPWLEKTVLVKVSSKKSACTV